VRAFNSTLGNGGMESMDSNQVHYPTLQKIDVDPISVDTTYYQINSDGTGGSYFSYNAFKNKGVNEFISGRTYNCVNCNAGPYPEARYWGFIKFKIPENTDIQSARLIWTTDKFSTDTAGATDIPLACGTMLGSQIEGETNTTLLANTMNSSTINTDVSGPVVMNKSSGTKYIDFLFAPPEKKPGPNWGRCLWYIKNISMQVFYLK
jgi:hypothetical protein